jgi:hypothetical protein
VGTDDACPQGSLSLLEHKVEVAVTDLSKFHSRYVSGIEQLLILNMSTGSRPECQAAEHC